MSSQTSSSLPPRRELKRCKCRKCLLRDPLGLLISITSYFRHQRREQKEQNNERLEHEAEHARKRAKLAAELEADKENDYGGMLEGGHEYEEDEEKLPEELPRQSGQFQTILKTYTSYNSYSLHSV
jgi:hypothetical protein